MAVPLRFRERGVRSSGSPPQKEEHQFVVLILTAVWISASLLVRNQGVNGEMTTVHGVSSLTHHQARPDSHHHFKPRRKLRYNFRDESGDGVPVIRFMEFCLIKTVDQYDVVFFG